MNQDHGTMKSGVTSNTTVSNRHQEEWRGILESLSQLAGPGNLTEVIAYLKTQTEFALKHPTQEFRIVLQGTAGEIKIPTQERVGAQNR